ncbi:MAG: hypothetical protein ACK5XN_09475 [Bacteroidota bacterium]
MTFEANFASIMSEPTVAPSTGDEYWPDVEKDQNGDGVSDASRVGVPAFSVPPPPDIVRLPNLTEDERRIEESFADAFEADPEKMASDYRKVVLDMAKEDNDVPTFATDDAKVQHPDWAGKGMPLEQRATNRAKYNCALHQTANAVAKRAFLQHLDTLSEGDQVLVTVGGCGAGKGHALKNSPAALEMKKTAKAIWDSAGDQNATENPWIQSELEKRGLKGAYLYVHADPRVFWMHEGYGVIARARKLDNGRMVDAAVFADSYVIGAKNHQAFYKNNKDNPNAKFLFLKSGSGDQLKEMPKEALELDRRELKKFALQKIAEMKDLEPRIRIGASIGTRVWRGEEKKKGGKKNGAKAS